MANEWGDEPWAEEVFAAIDAAWVAPPERLARINRLFLEKLAQRRPDHPWVRRIRMPDTTICKFHCEGVTPLPNSTAKTVRLRALYDQDLDEDRRFNKATPWGAMEFGLDNPAVDGFFEPGKAYYIEIRRA